MERLSLLINEISSMPDIHILGTVKLIQGLKVAVTVNSQLISIGSRCHIYNNQDKLIIGEVIGFQEDLAIITAFHPIIGIYPGCPVKFLSGVNKIYPSSQWRGRVINGLAQPLDEMGSLSKGKVGLCTHQTPPNAHLRGKVIKTINVGVRAINTFLTCCQGQRMGIFAGSGVGKSILLSMLANFTECDVCVIGLIGERGREVKEFLEDTLGKEGLKRSVVVVATSDENAIMRREAAYLTLTIAEYFRDQGLSVLCLLDSITRFAMAQREIGLSAGEPPATKGYTPSVFAELHKLLERAGPGIETKEIGTCGHITGFFTILVDGDDHNEPIADAARGILDGHIVLDRALAVRNHFPAINILHSISRKVPACHDQMERKLVKKARQVLSVYDDMAELIRLGAYKTGSHPDVDQAILLYPELQKFLTQDVEEHSNHAESFEQLASILQGLV